MKSLFFVSIVLSFSLIAAGCSTIAPGQVGVKTSLGTLKKESLDPGIHVALPLVDSIAKFDVRTVALPEEFATLTKDGQAIKVTGIAEYSINGKEAPEIFATIGVSMEDVQRKVIDPVLLSAVKVEVAERDLSQVVGDQNGMSSKISDAIAKELKANSLVNFISFRVTGTVLDKQVQDAIEQKQIAKQTLERKATEIETAKLEAQRLEILNKAITDKTIKDALVTKWDGKTPIGLDIFIEGGKK